MLRSTATLWSNPRKALQALAVLLVAISTSHPTQASAAVVVSNLDRELDAVVATLYNFADDFRDLKAAGTFTTGTSELNLNSLVLSFVSSFDTTLNQGGFTVSLYSDNAGLPGANLGIVFLGSSAPALTSEYTYTVCNPCTLAANTNYWVVASVDPFVLTTTSISAYHLRYTLDPTETVTDTASGWSIGSGYAYQDTGNTNGYWEKSPQYPCCSPWMHLLCRCPKPGADFCCSVPQAFCCIEGGDEAPEPLIFIAETRAAGHGV